MYKKILILITLFLFSCNSKDNSILIVVSFDGFRYDYVDYVDTPNFDFIAKNGVKAKSLKPVFPSLTFPNHYSIATGCYADKHKIIGNQFYDVKKDAFYSYKDSKTVQDGSWYGAEPIWVTANKNNKKSATYFWIGSEAEIDGIRPDIYKNFKPMVNPIEKVDEVITWIDSPINERPDLVMLYFDEPDHSGHVYGSLSREVLTQVEQMDATLGYLLDSLKKIKIDFNMIIVSDHGMVDVSDKKIINIYDYIKEDAFEVYGRGPFVSLKKNKQNAEVNDKILNATVYRKEDIPNRFHFVNENTLDYLVLANNGYMINPNKENLKKLPVVGMHGYDPDIIDMHGIFYAYGNEFKKSLKIDSFELINIYPLMCKLLNIPEYKDVDGSIEVFKGIFK